MLAARLALAVGDAATTTGAVATGADADLWLQQAHLALRLCYTPCLSSVHALLTCYLFYQFYVQLPFMCTTGPLFHLTGLLSDLAVISILSSYSLDASYLPYLPI